MLRLTTDSDTPPAGSDDAEGRAGFEAAWELASLDGDCAPALARHFRITDLQHWLDLCA
jgi:hypothetical protein